MAVLLTSAGPAQSRPVRKICLYNDSTLVREQTGICSQECKQMRFALLLQGA